MQEHKIFYESLKKAIAREFNITPEQLMGEMRYEPGWRNPGLHKFSEAFKLFLYFIYEYWNSSRIAVQLSFFARELGMNRTALIGNTWSELRKDRKFDIQLSMHIRNIQKEFPSLG